MPSKVGLLCHILVAILAYKRIFYAFSCFVNFCLAHCHKVLTSTISHLHSDQENAFILEVDHVQVLYHTMTSSSPNLSCIDG